MRKCAPRNGNLRLKSRIRVVFVVLLLLLLLFLSLLMFMPSFVRFTYHFFFFSLFTDSRLCRGRAGASKGVRAQHRRSQDTPQESSRQTICAGDRGHAVLFRCACVCTCALRGCLCACVCVCFVLCASRSMTAENKKYFVRHTFFCLPWACAFCVRR